jgi:hypothetical protein
LELPVWVARRRERRAALRLVRSPTAALLRLAWFQGVAARPRVEL